MGARDPRVDAYIGKAAGFAQPILTHLREVVHEVCPDVEETIKWGMPYFTHHGMLCGMAAFTQHCAFSFWKSSLMLEQPGRNPGAMGDLGRISSIRDLPPRRALAGSIREAARLNEAGIKAPRKKAAASAIEMPADLAAALGTSRKARTVFDTFSPSHQREYIEWITEAKRTETRQRRLTTTIEWLKEGKSRNWKYERLPIR